MKRRSDREKRNNDVIWSITLIAAAACAAIFYLGPPLYQRFFGKGSK